MSKLKLIDAKKMEKLLLHLGFVKAHQKVKSCIFSP
mgnify:CR=1 FL=1|jgi:predicted RNA binding protein YcfA (HicA-like mRNA interferase family)